MVPVVGTFCTKLERKCLRRRKKRQCAEYDAKARCVGTEVAKAFCIDRYEWPNVAGELPKVMNTWRDARASCTERGKRLCTEDEWTLACEGPERLGFPYGNVRDSTACPFDKPSPRVNEARLFYKKTQAAELARLDQRDPSGSYARCVSPFGVHDMTGSVDEWVHHPPGKPYRSSLKGGNWGEYRNACRPVTRGHGEGWRYYQTGFRCCSDLPSP
jgi:formylglycine-generating enzyme required for sulfatase activity